MKDLQDPAFGETKFCKFPRKSPILPSQFRRRVLLFDGKPPRSCQVELPGIAIKASRNSLPDVEVVCSVSKIELRTPVLLAHVLKETGKV